MIRRNAILLSCLFLVFILAYTTVSKLLNFPHYTRAMLAQPFLSWINQALIYLLPVVESVAITLLIIPATRTKGFWMTTALFFLFTTYTAVIKTTGMDKHTCPCGGLFSKLSWNQHLVVNITLTIIALASGLASGRQQNIFHGREKRRNADASE